MFWFSSLTTLFVFYSTKAQHCTWRRNHELTAHVVDAEALQDMCHFSFEKCSCNKMKEILFEVSTFFKSSTSPTAPVILKGLPTNSKPTFPSCKVNSQEIQTQPLLALRYWHLRSKGRSKGTRAWQNIIQSLSLNPLYQIEEDVGKISFNKSWGINMLVFYAKNIYFPQKNMAKEQAKGRETTSCV